jgi:hypothetical protein
MRYNTVLQRTSAAAFVVGPAATVASSAVLISAAFSATAATAETSLAIEADPLQPDPLGAVDVTTLGPGCDAVATPGACCPNSGGPLTVDLSL